MQVILRSRSLLMLALLAAAVTRGTAQQAGPVIQTYKTVGTEMLVVHVFTPPTSGTNRPAVLLFHGGGFVWGGPDITDGSARDYAARGLVAFSVQYRLANRSTITPLEQTEDTFDAIRWVRAHAAEYDIDPNRIVAHGVSAGGYLAAMAAGSSDDSVRPNVLVLWSPGVGAGDDPYFQGLLMGRARGTDISPLKHIRIPMPATIIISGALDSVTFDRDAQRYCAKLTEAKGRCDRHSYPSLGHLLSRRLDAVSQQRGQFDWDPVATKDAEEKVWAFLQSLGYIAR